MRTLVFLAMIFTLSGCSALMVGGGSTGSGSPYKNDERTAQQTVTDRELSSSVKTRLASDSRVSMFDITTRATAGKVTLSGTVDTYAARERAEKIAIGIDGVAAVDNQIKVQN